MFLPRTGRDAFRLRLHERLIYDGLTAFFERTGLWSYPISAEGDLEHMSVLDKAYWFYKAQNPIQRARRGSRLEEFFAAQPAHRWSLPPGFAVERELSVSAAGDLMWHAFLARSEKTLYAPVADLVFGADVSMANLEMVLLPAGAEPRSAGMQSGPPLAGDPDEFRALKGCSGRQFDLFALGNNHCLDFGAAGVDSTIRTLHDAGIAFHGVNERDQDASQPAILRRNGISLGIVSFTFGLNARRPPPERPLIANRMNLNGQAAALDLALLDRQLHACQAEGVDFVIAQLHWGMEYERYPRPEQVEVAHLLAERGVDTIIGHHPHMVQPFELYRTRRDPERIVPIYYSLGSLVNPCSIEFMCVSAVARLQLVSGAAQDGNRRTYVRHAGVHEVVQVADPDRGVIALQPFSSRSGEPPTRSSPRDPR